MTDYKPTHILLLNGATTRGRVREMTEGYYGFIPGIRTKLYKSGVHEVAMVPVSKLRKIPTDNLPTVRSIEVEARKKYPNQSWAWYSRYALMTRKILGWEKEVNSSRLPEEQRELVILLYVGREQALTRSPAKKRAIEDWRIEQAEFEGT